VQRLRAKWIFSQSLYSLWKIRENARGLKEGLLLPPVDPQKEKGKAILLLMEKEQKKAERASKEEETENAKSQESL
jgi:hypothetical protein